MSCSAPKTIYNNSNYVDTYHWDVKRLVPCGKCLDCQRSRQTEYAVRGYYEYLEAQKDGGYTYWDTLTYRPENLPTACKWLVPSGIPCFSKKHIQKFIKRIRMQMLRNYGIGKDAFRYFCVTEYGGNHGLPHYHIMFFVHDPKLTLSRLHDLIYKNWFFYYGRTDVNRSCGRVLTSTAAINYVTKYLCKSESRLRPLYNKIGEKCISLALPVPSERTLNKYFSPWQLHSIGFGRYLFDCVDQRRHLDNLQCTFATKNNPNKLVSLPMYYRRARSNGACVFDLYTIEYRVHPTEPNTPDGKPNLVRSWHGTDKLARIYTALYSEKIHKLADRIKSKVDNVNEIYAEIERNSPSEFNKLVGYIAKLQSYASCNSSFPRTVFNSLVSGCCLRDLAIYLSDKRGRFDFPSLAPRDLISKRCCGDSPDINPLKFGSDYDIKKAKDFYSRSVEYDRSIELAFSMLNKIYAVYASIESKLDEEKRLKAIEIKHGLPLAYKALY